MLNVRFLRPNNGGHASFSVKKYEVIVYQGEVEVMLYMSDSVESVFIGMDHPYCIAFVTNEAGKTIDKISA